MGEKQVLRAERPVIPAIRRAISASNWLAQPELGTGTRNDGAPNDFRGHNSAD